VTSSPTADQPKQRKGQRRPRFWVAPLLVGTCFSLGFGITKRVAILQANAEMPRTLMFAPARFPGRELARLRSLYGGAPGDLQVDVSALPVTPAVEVETPKPALQAAITSSQPTWTQPVWSDDPVDEVVVDEVVDEPAEQQPLPLVLGLPPMQPSAFAEPEPPDAFFMPVEAPPAVVAEP